VLEDATPEEVIERDYHLQRLVYALACFRAGAEEVEVVYQFLERPDPAVTTSFVRSELPGLEAELSEAIARIQEGVFKPTPSEFNLLRLSGSRRRLRGGRGCGQPEIRPRSHVG